MSGRQQPKATGLILAAVAVFGVGVAGFLAMLPVSEPSHGEVDGPRPPGTVAVAEPEPVPTSPPVELTPSEQSGAGPREPSSEPGASAPTRLARDLQREQIWRALGRKHALEPAGSGSAAPTEAAAKALPTLDRDYVREAIKEQLVPAAVDCYEAVLERDPELAGELLVEFTIIGDEDIGGVVEEVRLAEGSTLADPFVRECVEQSMLAVTFAPPPEGGRVEVHYPLRFSPDDPEG